METMAWTVSTPVKADDPSAECLVQQTECDDVPSLSAVFGRQRATQVTGLRQHARSRNQESLLPIPLLRKRFNIQAQQMS